MAKFFRITGVALISTLFVTGGIVGCTQKPSNEESGKLNEARAAAESAERKLSDLRMERVKLEKDLEGAASEEQGEEQELEEETEAP